MFCSKCGAKNDDNAKFCFQCGNRFDEAGVIKPQQPQTPAGGATYNQPQGAPFTQVPYQQQAPGYGQQQAAPNYGQQGQAYSQPQGPSFGQPGPNYQPQMPGQGFELPVKSKKPLYLGLGGVAAVLVIIVLISVFSSKGGKVFDNILSAAKGTIESDSFDFSLELTEDYSGRYTQEANGTVVLDFDKEDISFDIDTGDGEREILYDGVVYDIEDDEVWNSEDISSELGDIFDYYDEYKGAFKGLSGVDWEDAFDEAGLSGFVDTDKLSKCMKEFEKNINSEKYWKEVCNEFSAKKSGGGTTYTFDVDVPKLVESLLDTFGPAIDYNLNSMKKMVSNQVDIFDECVIEVTIKNNKLTALNVNVTYDDYGDTVTYEFKGEISNYGKAKLDTDEIEEVIQNEYEWE